MAPKGAERIGKGGGSKANKGKEATTKDKEVASTSASKAVATELRIECRRKNAPGVRLIANTPEKNAQIVAAYLQFDSVSELKAFIATEGMWTPCRTSTISILILVCTTEVEAIVTELNNGITANFNVVGAKACLIINKTFHSTLRAMKDAEWTIIVSPGTIPLNFKPVGLKANDPRLMYLNYTCAVLRLMAEAGDHIPDDDPEVAGTFRGYTPENWNRGLILAKFCIRESGASRMKTATKSRSTSSAKDTIADLEFLTDEDFATMLEDPVEGADNDENRYNFFNARQALEDAIEDDESEDEAAPEVRCPKVKDLKDLDAHDADLAKVFTTRLPAAVNASLSRQVRSQRQLISKQETFAFCQGLKRRITINWGSEDIDRIRSSDASTSSRNMQDKVISLGQQIAKEQQEGTEDEGGDLDDAAQELVHKAALDIKATMTQNSAPPPDYLEACDWCGVDPNTRRFVACPEYEDDDSLPQTYLKFWQPLGKYSPPDSSRTGTASMLIIVQRPTSCIYKSRRCITSPS